MNNILNECPVKVLLEHPLAKNPTRSYGTSAAFDVFAVEDTIIEPHSAGYVNVGLKFMIPNGYFVKFWPRSGMGLNKNIFVFPGLLDAGYAGDCSVKLYNCSDVPYEVKAGKAVTQVEVGRMVDNEPTMRSVTVEEYNNYESQAARGNNGLGSTGQ